MGASSRPSSQRGRACPAESRSVRLLVLMSALGNASGSCSPDSVTLNFSNACASGAPYVNNLDGQGPDEDPELEPVLWYKHIGQRNGEWFDLKISTVSEVSTPLNGYSYTEAQYTGQIINNGCQGDFGQINVLVCRNSFCVAIDSLANHHSPLPLTRPSPCPTASSYPRSDPAHPPHVKLSARHYRFQSPFCILT